MKWRFLIAMLSLAVMVAPASAQPSDDDDDPAAGGATTGSRTPGTADTGPSPAKEPGSGGSPEAGLGGPARTGGPASDLVDPSGSTTGLGINTGRSQLDSKLVLTSTIDTQIASASFGGRRGDWFWQAGVHAPVRRGTAEVVLADLDGLADRASVDVAVSYLHWKPTEDLTAMTEVCAEYTVETYVCDAEHESTGEIRAELRTAQDAVCRAHRTCSLDAVVSAEGKREFMAVSEAVYDRAKAALCELQKQSQLESKKICRRAEVVKAGKALLVRYDRAKSRAQRQEVCREVIERTFECREHDKEVVERKALELGLNNIRAEVCDKHIPCTRESLPTSAARRAWDEAVTPICERDKRDILSRPKQRVTRVCTRNLLVREWRRAGANSDPDSLQRTARLRHLITRWDRSHSFNQTVLVSARLRAARETLHYMDADTLTQGSTTANMGAAALSIASVIPGFGSVIGTYEFQQDYQEGEKSQFCEPFGMAGATKCDVLSLGVPQRLRTHTARLELRRFFSEKFALAIRGSYEFTDAVFGLEVPIYFLRNRRRGLAGGVSLGFRSDMDEPIVSLFISERLTLLPWPR